MAIDVNYVIDKHFGAIYDGTNAADFDAAISNFTILSEVSGVLQFESSGINFTAQPGDWIHWIQGTVYNVWAQAEFDFFVTAYSGKDEVDAISEGLTDLSDNVDSLTTAIGVLSDATVRSIGAAAVPLLLASAQATVPVTLYPALLDTSYTPHAHLFGGINLGPLEILSATPVSTTVTDVVVRNNGLLSLTGATVLVSVVS